MSSMSVLSSGGPTYTAPSQALKGKRKEFVKNEYLTQVSAGSGVSITGRALVPPGSSPARKGSGNLPGPRLEPQEAGPFFFPARGPGEE